MSVPPEATPRVRQTVSATTGLSPVTILTVMPSAARRAIEPAADGFGWSRNDEEAGEVQVVLVVGGDRGELRCASRVATATTRLPALNSRVEHPAGLVGDVGAAVEDRFGGALGDEEPLVVVVDEHRDAAAIVVERRDGDPAERRRSGARPTPGASHSATSSGLPPTAASPDDGGFVAHEPEREHVRAVVAGRVDRPLEADVAVGEGAGLVGEQHVDVAEVLDAHEPLDEDLLLGEPTRAGGQARRHDRGQQLGGDADRDGEREQHRLDDRPAQQRR